MQKTNTMLNFIDRTAFEAVPIIGVRRHRLLTDGDGITALVGFHGCPLHCAYCLNPQCNSESGIQRWITPESLYKELRCDDFYFRSTGGGLCFGGGEPLLRYAFIKEFRKFCGDKWTIAVETSLNVPQKNLVALIDVIDEYIVDIKDWASSIYTRYTGADNNKVKENIEFLVQKGKADAIHIRVPLIPQYNTEQDVEHSIEQLTGLGITRFERFKYITESFPSQKNDIDGDTKMPIGKAICEVLKKVRLTIAEANQINYRPAVCNHKGNCSGTCPMCEYELKSLSEELWKRESEGKSINI